MATGVGIKRLTNNIIRNKIFWFQELAETYKPALNRRKETLTEILKEKANAASKTKLARKLRVLKEYAVIEMSPPSREAELKQLMKDLDVVIAFLKNRAFLFLTVKEAWLLLLVVIEVGCWFFMGETIGKMSLVGYKV